MNGENKQNRIALSSQALEEIEAALNEPLFLGMPVGATMNDTLIMALYTSNRVWNLRSRVENSLRYLYNRFRQPSFSSKDFSQYEGRIVFTWLFDRTDLKAFITPVLDNYGYNDSMVVVPYASMQTQLNDRTISVVWSDFPKIDMKVWRREFDRCVPVWRYNLRKLMEKHSVPNYVVEYLLYRLQIQTKRVMANSKFLDVVKPKAIVTECDRSGLSSCLLLAARQKGIPSVTMIHGALEPYPAYGFFPTLADYVCCWGERHKQILIEYGVSEEQLIVTGSQAISETLDVSSNTARMKVGLPVDKPIVLLATSTYKPEYKAKYAQAFCDAMAKMVDIKAVVRIHPGESIIEYQGLIEKFPQITFLSNEKMTRDESIAAADIIVSHESSYGVDAILKGKLVIVLDVLTMPLKVGKDLIDMAGCPGVKSVIELRKVIWKILSNDSFRSSLHMKAKYYAKQYCESFGQDAVDNVCRVIDNTIKGL